MRIAISERKEKRRSCRRGTAQILRIINLPADVQLAAIGNFFCLGFYYSLSRLIRNDLFRRRNRRPKNPTLRLLDFKNAEFLKTAAIVCFI